LKKWAFSAINSSFFISLTPFSFLFLISLLYTLIFIILLFSIYPGVYKRENKRGNVIGAKLEVGKPHMPHGEWKGCRGNSNIALEAIFSPYAPYRRRPNNTKIIHTLICAIRALITFAF
jgi:hypothetical protein